MKLQSIVTYQPVQFVGDIVTSLVDTKFDLELISQFFVKAYHHKTQKLVLIPVTNIAYMSPQESEIENINTSVNMSGIMNLGTKTKTPCAKKG